MSIEKSTKTLAELANSGAVPPHSFEDAIGLVRTVAAEPLDSRPLEEIVSDVLKFGYYDRLAVEDAVVGLHVGHLLLSGPPGSGKTYLARLLANAFGASLHEETANPEWSVYDVIGSKTLNVEGGGSFKHGCVTQAILDCAATIVKNLKSGDPPQANWLLIDEINRAEIDRAFGPLFTAFSGDDSGSFPLDYLEKPQAVAVPNRFRIIASLNDYDTRFVNSMSAALRRRFVRIVVSPPSNGEGNLIPEREFEIAFRRAEELAKARIGQGCVDAAHDLVAQNSVKIRELIGGLRGGVEFVGLPVGTAQIIDTLTYSIVLIGLSTSNQDSAQFMKCLDRAFAARLVSGLESDATRNRLSDGKLVSALETKWKEVPSALKRLHNFIDAID